MMSSVLSFVVAAALVVQLPTLPPAAGVWLALPAGTVMLRFRLLRCLGAGLLGFWYACWTAGGLIADEIPASLEAQDLTLTGIVSSLPQTGEGLVRFRFQLSGCDQCWTHTTVNLSWYRRGSGVVQIKPGQRWRLTVRLSRPRGTVNDGLFDYEGWLLSEGVAATGYVRSDPPPKLLDESSARYPHHRLRMWIRGEIERSLNDGPLQGLLIALTIGESGRISSQQWRTLSDTGTNHLLIISGLHVGLVAVFAYRLLGMTRWAAIASLIVATGYGAIAGLGLPVQRALVMATVALSGRLLARRVTTSDMFCAALFAVTLLDPLAVLRTGFWLSFGAVFALLFAFAGQTDWRTGWLRAAIRTQWVVFVGMLVLLLSLVYQVSLLAFVVNIVAIPWIGLAVIPLLLLGIPAFVIHEELGAMIISLAQVSLSGLWQFLEWAAGLHWVFYASERSILLIAAGLLGCWLLISPRGVVPRWPGVLLAVAMLFPARDLLASGEVVMRVLDVGQGLAVLIETRSHVLVYDAGPKYGDRFDVGEQIVTPMLRRDGYSRVVNHLVISHGDNDHAGGASAILRNFLVIDARYPCQQGASFERDGVSFHLRAALGEGRVSNDSSCVLTIRTGGFSTLLPGDIEAEGERELLVSGLENVDVLIAPHHGSRSSSGPAFINRTSPRFVIFSTGFGNRFGHPDREVVHRYCSRGIKMINTATEGAVTVRYHPVMGLSVVTARTGSPRFWYDSDSVASTTCP